MIKLSLNSPEVPKAQAPFANTLAAAVEAASVQPAQAPIAQSAIKKQPKAALGVAPSHGLLTRGVQWLQNKGRSKKRLHMIETVSLGEKRFVALVKVDGREFLLGGAPSSVSMLSDLGEHGLGELLSLPAIAKAAVAEAPAVTPTPRAQQMTVVTTPLELPNAVETGKVQVAETFELPLEDVAAGSVAEAAPATPARVNVMVEADEEESHWLQEDDLDTVFKSAISAESPVAQKERANLIEFRSEPAVTRSASPEKVALLADSAPQPAAPASTACFPAANFTFQMWPTASTTAITATPKTAAPEVSTPKSKTSIDLESCPELLGEPYLLALVEKSVGAAA